MMKISIIEKLLLIFILLSIQTTFAQVVLIDPGHGGTDCGAKGKLWKKKSLTVFCEKDVALSFAKEIKKAISSDFKTYMTRSIDRDISLHDRANLADKIKADIFISIHINSSNSKHSHGIETFYLDNHNSVAIKKIEAVENQNKKGEELVINQILAELVIRETAPKSRKLAHLIHKELNHYVLKKYKVKDRGVKPALFYVLALSKRPSVLLEVGFISNKSDLKKLLTRKFQRKYAYAVRKALLKYFNKKKAPPLF